MSFFEYGFEIIDDFIDPIYLQAIKSEISVSDFKIRSAGIRNAEKKFHSVQALLDRKILANKAEFYLKGKPNLVRTILFDKTPTNNWLASWHQDKTITVSAKQKIEGWGAWSVKDGHHHVQPKIDVLNKMVTFRIHIDESTQENGCLRVIPRSHEFGIMSQAQIRRHIQSTTPFSCVAKSGSALVMRPHILHASSKATVPSHRRVLHIEYSSYTLPSDLKWA